MPIIYPLHVGDLLDGVERRTAGTVADLVERYRPGAVIAYPTDDVDGGYGLSPYGTSGYGE